MQCKNCERTIPDDAIFCQWCGEKQIKEKRKKKQGVSIPKIRQLPSGMYFCQLRINGESISITEKDYNTVEAKAKALKAGILERKKKVPEITLRQCIYEYINENSGRWSPTTAPTYVKIAENAFQDIMDVPISTLSQKKLSNAVNNECNRITRRGKKPSAKTVKDEYMLIVTVLSERYPELDTSVPLPKIKRKIPDILTPEEIIPAIKGSSIELYCLLAMWLSLTASEIRGLTKSKSIRNGLLIVCETVVDVKGQAVRKEGGKEEERTRALSLPPYIAELIDKVEGDVICPLSGSALSSRFRDLLKRKGLRHMRFHDLRHVNASVMAELQIPEKEILERGGWKSDYVAKRVYTHTFTRQRKAADILINSYFEKIYDGIR